MSSQTPKKKRGRPKKNEVNLPVPEPLEKFTPKVEKVEKVELPPRRFGAAKFKEQPLDRTLKGTKLSFLKPAYSYNHRTKQALR